MCIYIHINYNIYNIYIYIYIYIPWAPVASSRRESRQCIAEFDFDAEMRACNILWLLVSTLNKQNTIVCKSPPGRSSPVPGISTSNARLRGTGRP